MEQVKPWEGYKIGLDVAVENMHSVTVIGLDGSCDTDVGHTNKQEAWELREVTCEY